MTPTPSSSTDTIDPERLKRAAGLATVEVLAEACSTMDRARELAADPTCPLPAAVVADRQTLGRGRRGARWWQPPESLAVSLVVDAAVGPRPIWSLACGVAVAEAIRSLEPSVAAVVRWPNDIEVDGRKLAGILVETAAVGRTIFGIGVNTTGSVQAAPKGLRHRLVTLPDLTGRPLPRQRLLAAVVPRLLMLLADLEADSNALASRYRPLCTLDGTFVRVHSADGVQSGTCRGIAEDGSLVLDTAAGRVFLRSGSLTPPGDEWRGDAAD
ncbi:MAG: biotin--[acetyl-CoA-carboxylase] ligase [Planctomycetia bacterium]|nr:biotin--[acetyl-CoA-carboxylase] ligase [Planctomycetia bacterium]